MPNKPEAQPNQETTAPSTSSHRLSFLAIGLALAAVVVFVALHLIPSEAPKLGRLDGKLNVLVRPPNRTVEPIAVDQPGALPVQSGGAMCLDVQLNQSAFVYLVWIDSSGQLVPLYPWNNETLEIKDIDQPPPERRPGKLIFSPLLGKTWTFAAQPGTEIVLLLARKEPLPREVKLSVLLQPLSPPPKLDSSNLLAMAQAGGSMTTESAKKEPSSVRSNAQLAVSIEPLKEHFDLIQAVQFAHADENGESTPPSR